MKTDNIVNKELVDKYCKEFTGRYLTIKKLKSLTESERWFHFDGHWNILQFDGDYIYHSKMYHIISK